MGVWALGALLCALFACSLSASPAAAACTNEQLRSESNVNPATKEPFSKSLPDCRAYEMVSPLYKQAHSALPLPLTGLAASPSGETVGWASEGDFAGAENYTVHGHPNNPYLSQRGVSGWSTSSAFAPYSLVNNPTPRGLEGDTSPDLRSARISCGSTSVISGQNKGVHLACARTQHDGAWASTPLYTGVAAQSAPQGQTELYFGGTLDLSRLFLIPWEPFSPSDSLEPGGIYEVENCCSESSTLRLVNVDNEAHELLYRLNGTEDAPLIGDSSNFISQAPGTAYHAVSASGTVFFTAWPHTPAGNETDPGETDTVYARTRCVHTALNEATCKEDKEGPRGEFFETVPVSNPTQAECNACGNPLTRPPAAPATFEGASADGTKVFFTTQQKLLNKDGTRNLYEYDFHRKEGERLVLLSPDEAGANVMGVVRSSPDGSHVYFVADGVLTGEEENHSTKQKAVEGNSNLYGYDTVTGETKFVATAAPSSGTIVPNLGEVEAEPVPGVPLARWRSSDEHRPAQTTPDGRYLVFSGQLSTAGDTNNKGCPAPGHPGACPLAVYLYDFQTGTLTWVSRPAPGSPGNEGKPALIAALPGTRDGAEANIDSWGRSISGCAPKGLRSEAEEAAFSCPEGTYDGEYIIFVSEEHLQGTAVNASELYEWHTGGEGHPGEVHLISDGHAPEGIEAERGTEPVAMSASGSDIFFITGTALVGQDTDSLHDVYDARVGGGFAAPRPACSGEGCLPQPPGHESFPLAASSLFTGGVNVSTVTTIGSNAGSSTQSKPKPLTRAQLLAKALKACKKKPKKKRHSCEAQARRKYGAKTKSKKGRARK
jgi:hypothetical protein